MGKNIYYSKGNIGEDERKSLTGNKSGVFWFYGLSGSGKSAISRAVEENLIKQGILCFRLDGDNLRSGLNSDLGFSKEDRLENIRRAAETAKLLAEAGIVVLATFITPLIENRDTAKAILGNYYNPIYIKCSVDTCRNRDPKGLYKRAVNGEIPDFTGVSAPFDEPLDDTFTINSEKTDEKACVDIAEEHILNLIK